MFGGKRQVPMTIHAVLLVMELDLQLNTPNLWNHSLLIFWFGLLLSGYEGRLSPLFATTIRYHSRI